MVIIGEEKLLMFGKNFAQPLICDKDWSDRYSVYIGSQVQSYEAIMIIGRVELGNLSGGKLHHLWRNYISA